MIGNLVLDTDIASFVFKGDTRVELYRDHIDGKLWAVSFQTVAELEQWALLRGWGERRRRELEEFLSTFVIVNPDRDLCRLWGQVRVDAKRKGRPIDTADAWIAATSLRFGVPLVTHNRSDFLWVEGLSVISEA